jgi:hypothetical protein
MNVLTGNTGGANNQSLPRRGATDTGRAAVCRYKRDKISGAVLGSHKALDDGQGFSEAQRSSSAVAEGGPLERRVERHLIAALNTSHLYRI